MVKLGISENQVKGLGLLRKRMEAEANGSYTVIRFLPRYKLELDRFEFRRVFESMTSGPDSRKRLTFWRIFLNSPV